MTLIQLRCIYIVNWTRLVRPMNHESMHTENYTNKYFIYSKIFPFLGK